MSGKAGRPLGFLLLGEQSLLVRCAERLLEQGHAIAGVVSEDRRILEWASQRNLPSHARFEVLQAEPPAGGFDYLLSITNLRILPAWLLRMPRLGAINFHDGPLPRYAGLNAPVWSLLNGEDEHGVTWHELTAGVDQGRILASQRFAVAADETAFGLNAQCYEAGYESFAALLSHIESGALQPVAQDLRERSYFGLAQRPAKAGSLDWSRTAEELAREVRALDFGRYPNPVLLPKIDLGSGLLLAREATVEANPPGKGTPGQLLRTVGGDLAVRCAQGALVLRRVTDLSGGAVDPASALAAAGFPEGSVLPAPETAPELDATVQRLARHEAWWLRQLRSPELTPAPYSRRDAPMGGAAATRDISMPATGAERAVAVLALLLARLTNRRDVAFALVPRSLASIDARLQRFVAPRAILSARFDPADAFASVAGAADRTAGPLRGAHRLAV